MNRLIESSSKAWSINAVAVCYMVLFPPRATQYRWSLHLAPHSIDGHSTSHPYLASMTPCATQPSPIESSSCRGVVLYIDTPPHHFLTSPLPHHTTSHAVLHMNCLSSCTVLPGGQVTTPTNKLHLLPFFMPASLLTAEQVTTPTSNSHLGSK